MSAGEFKQVLKQLRERAGLNQAELAKRLGVDQGSVSRWENGRSEPSISMAVPLATALGVPVEALIGEPPAKPARKPKKK